MSAEIKRLRGLIEDLIFFIENQGDYIGHLTEEGVRRSSQDFIVKRLEEEVNWITELDRDSLTKTIRSRIGSPV